MQYMGGKARIARRLVNAILADTQERGTWFEPFIGGGNVMEHACLHFKDSIGLDAHPDLILMWDHVAKGGLVPPFVTKEEYQKLRHEPSSWLRGFAGFGASFGGKWFGGYGVSPRDGEVCRQSYRTVSRQGSTFASNKVQFLNAAFGDVEPPTSSVVYCDPPYEGTTKFNSTTFDYPKFSSTLVRWANAGHHIYLSEYKLPRGMNATTIWSRDVLVALDKTTNARRATENLYRVDPQ